MNDTIILRKPPTENMVIASTILRQLGGNRFLCMTGAKNLAECERGLAFRLSGGITKDRINAVKITLQPDDLYTIKFMKMTKSKLTVVKESEGVYCDMLQEIFTNYTGLYTHV